MRDRIKNLVKNTPLLGPAARWAVAAVRRVRFAGSAGYWEANYRRGGDSGPGSYGDLARFKAEVLNRFVTEQKVRTVIEFGCGDGHQLSLADYPEYVGLDVSKEAIRLCQMRFGSDEHKSFFLYEPQGFVDRTGVFRADLALSLDVIYHLVEDRIFELYMRHLFASAERFVIVYSSDTEGGLTSAHVRHRRFTPWVARNASGWRLWRKIVNRFPEGEYGEPGSFADFYIYRRSDDEAQG